MRNEGCPFRQPPLRVTPGAQWSLPGRDSGVYGVGVEGGGGASKPSRPRPAQILAYIWGYDQEKGGIKTLGEIKSLWCAVEVTPSHSRVRGGDLEIAETLLDALIAVERTRGTYKTVKARFCPHFDQKSLKRCLVAPFFARQRLSTRDPTPSTGQHRLCADELAG